jgi:hypothetical protein
MIVVFVKIASRLRLEYYRQKGFVCVRVRGRVGGGGGVRVVSM